MARYFAPITIDELRGKIEKQFNGGTGAGCFDVRTLVNGLRKDLKVEFDLENVDYPDDPHPFGPESLVGYWTLANGMTYLGLCAGGDWESPVFFVVYWDGRKLRGYVPTDGNPWNTDTGMAYGNDATADLANVKKRWPTAYADASSIQDIHADDVDDLDFPDFDGDLIAADMAARILPKPHDNEKPKRQKRSRPACELLRALRSAIPAMQRVAKAYEKLLKDQ